MAKAVVLYRIASVLFILYAVGHTSGFLKFQPPSAEGRAVWESMNNVHFQLGQTEATYGKLYVSFGLFISLYVLFAAYLAWYLGGLARNTPQAIGPLGWVFFAVQLGALALSAICFLPPPAILTGLAAICVGCASWLVSTTRP